MGDTQSLGYLRKFGAIVNDADKSTAQRRDGLVFASSHGFRPVALDIATVRYSLRNWSSESSKSLDTQLVTGCALFKTLWPNLRRNSHVR